MQILARPSKIQRNFGSWFRLSKLEGANPVLIIGSVNSGCTNQAQIISSRPRYIHRKSITRTAGRIAAIMSPENHPSSSATIIIEPFSNISEPLMPAYYSSVLFCLSLSQA